MSALDNSALDHRVERRFRTERFYFEGGAESEGLEIAYWSVGELNAARDNAVLLSHGASGNKDWPAPFVRPEGAFDPRRWFLISADMPGGGDSSRRSSESAFPEAYGVHDVSRAFAALLDGLSIKRLRAFCGPSMASLVGLDLAYCRPDLVGGLALWLGGFRADGFARATVEALISVLQLSPSPAGMRAALRAFVPALLSRERIAALPQSKYEALIEGLAAEWAVKWRIDELIARYRAIAHCDLGMGRGGEESFAASIQCPVLWLLCSTDAIFPPAQTRGLAKHMRSAEVKVKASDLGHMAYTAPQGSPEFEFFDCETARFITSLA